MCRWSQQTVKKPAQDQSFTRDFRDRFLKNTWGPHIKITQNRVLETAIIMV